MSTKTKTTRPDGGTARVAVQGLTLDIDPAVFDDFELLEEMAAVADGDALRAVPLVRRVLGEDYRRVLDHLRTGTGRVPATAVVGFLTDLMGAVSPNS